MYRQKKKSKKKNVPRIVTSSSEEENVDADASETKAVVFLPKKRPYDEPQTQTEKQIPYTIKIVTKQTDAVKEVIAGLPTKLNNKSGATDKKSQEPEFTASHKPTVKPARETGKKQSQKASVSQPSTSQASTSQPSTLQPLTLNTSTSKPSKTQASTSKASKSKKSISKATESQAPTPQASKSQELTSKATSKSSSSQEPSASTSVASSSTRNYDSQFWAETMNSKFKNSAYKNFLIQSNFTEPQANLLQNFFHQAARKMYNTFMNSDRIMKKHNCRDCMFSMCHMCVSINFLHVGWGQDDPMASTVFVPHKIHICQCNFAFFHAHTSRPSRSDTLNTGSFKRIAKLRCAVCDTIIMIEHTQVEDTDCTLTNWSDIDSSDEKMFHAKLVDHIKGFKTTQTISLKELYTCNNHCCLFFHRCTE